MERGVFPIVITRYVNQRTLAVSLILGIILKVTGPGTSARKIRLAPTPNCESRATKKTMIPIPPSQCVRLLQKRIPLGSPSTFEKILAPVVVNPETVSKKASGKLLHTPDSR
jgi:hypothetical protein